jgi:hypothetical protein
MYKFFGLTLVLGLWSLGCSDYSAKSSLDEPHNADNSSSGNENYARQCYGANECSPGYYCNEFGYCALLKGQDGSTGQVDAGLPPEVENKKEAPASGKNYVYVAVPKQNMVAKIDSSTLQVRAIKVGSNPGALQTINGQDIALLLNRSSASATLLRSKPDGSDENVTLATVFGLNRLAIAPDGRSAIAFYDVSQSDGNLPPQQTIQEVTLLKLDPPGKEKSINISTGFRPVDVQFSQNSSHAYVVTEEGISIIEIAVTNKPLIAPFVSLLKDVFNEQKPDEVLITPDGKVAILRQSGLQGIRVADLTTTNLTDIALGSDATDIDLTEDGSLLIAVLRDSSEVALIDIPSDLEDPTQIEIISVTGSTIGQVSLSSDGKHAFLYSNATPQKVALIADLSSRQIVAYPLKKGVRAVYGTPDGTKAVIMHNKVPGTPKAEEGTEAFIDKSFGYSMISLASGFVKLQLTEANPEKLTFAADSLSGYLLLNDSSQDLRTVECLNLDTFQVESITMGSPPVALGILPGTQKVYAAQSHPLGRITFIEQKTHATKTITGFELNSYVIE